MKKHKASSKEQAFIDLQTVIYLNLNNQIQ